MRLTDVPKIVEIVNGRTAAFFTPEAVIAVLEAAAAVQRNNYPYCSHDEGQPCCFSWEDQWVVDALLNTVEGNEPREGAYPVPKEEEDEP